MTHDDHDTSLSMMIKIISEPGPAPALPGDHRDLDSCGPATVTGSCGRHGGLRVGLGLGARAQAPGLGVLARVRPRSP